MEVHGQSFSQEFHDALRRALSECIKKRPADPFKFIAGRTGTVQSSIFCEAAVKVGMIHHRERCQPVGKCLNS